MILSSAPRALQACFRFILFAALVVASCFTDSLAAQITLPPGAEAQAREQLRLRGIEDQEVITRLRARGFDVENLNSISPSQIPALEKAIQEVVAEIESEQAEGATPATGAQVPPPNSGQPAQPPLKAAESAPVVPGNTSELTEGITEAVEGGSTVGEAVAEELAEEAKDALPGATIYGQQIFRDQTLRVFQKSTETRPPSDYVLGVGDLVGVAIFGQSQASYTYEVQPGGFIEPDGIGRIYIQGLTFERARELLRSRFGRYYVFRPEEFELTLTYSRTISVNIVGEVFNPGSYSIPAINTAFNALVASGGPTDIGSVRNIQLSRNGDTARTLDVYKFLLAPQDQPSLFLEDNDFIFVPPAGKVVSIVGAIKRPFRYELLESETLGELIDYAGGFRQNAIRTVAQVTRYRGSEEVVIDVPLGPNGEGDSFALVDGDRVAVPTIERQFDNVVTLAGEVNRSGQFALSDGLRLSDLLQEAGLRRTTRRDFGYLRRTNDDGTIAYLFIDFADVLANEGGPNDLVLKPQDKVQVFALSRFTDSGQYYITGAVRSPDSFAISPETNLRLTSAIELAGGLKPDASPLVFVRRTIRESPDSVLLLRVYLDGLEPGSERDLVLRQQDRISVISRANFVERSGVFVQGAVRNGGEFPYAEGFTLRDAVTLAGGLVFGAEPNRVDIYRVNLGADETQTIVLTEEIEGDFLAKSATVKLEPYDQVVVRYRADFELQQVVQLGGEVRYPGPYALTSPDETVAQIVERAGGLTDEAFPEGATLFREYRNLGYVALRLDEALDRKSSPQNVTLKQGDRIEIPKTLDLVTVKGATRLSEATFEDVASTGRLSAPYVKGKRARYYVNEFAGGISDNGYVRGITVTYPNGQTKRTQNFGLFKITPGIRPGATVSVPVEPAPEPEDPAQEPQENVNWGEVAANIVGQAVSILSLVLLLNRA